MPGSRTCRGQVLQSSKTSFKLRLTEVVPHPSSGPTLHDMPTLNQRAQMLLQSIAVRASKLVQECRGQVLLSSKHVSVGKRGSAPTAKTPNNTR